MSDNLTGMVARTIEITGGIIEKQAAEIERLRAALQEIAAWLPDEPIKAADIARHALESKP